MVLTECSLVVTAAGGVGLGVAALAGHAGARRIASFTAAVSVGALVVSLVPVRDGLQTAAAQGVTVSLAHYLPRPPAGAPSQTVTYLGADASSVRRLDMWLVPEGAGARGRRHPAVVLVHGGGWDQGSRGGSLLPGWLAGRGYVVFDIDYRLATPTSPSWQQATGDVKCAVGWVNDHAARFGVDPERIALLESSAGGHLALLAAYSTSEPALPASCQTSDADVTAVAALYPVSDLAALYRAPTRWWNQSFAIPALVARFVGGTPTTVPDRSRMEDPTVMSRQPAVPRQRPDQGRVRSAARSAVRQWPQWVCYATVCWSLLYGVLGSFWALGGAGFPFGGAHDDTVLATSRAATAGPVIAAVGLAGGVLALVMAQGRGRGPARRLLIGVGATMAVSLALVIPGHRPLMALARTPLVLIGAPFGWPPQLSLGEFFTSMYPWPVINELLLILGGLLWAAATLASARRTGDACAHCGRSGHAAAWTTPANARRWGAWAVAVAVAVPTFYALTRWAWALGIPLGFSRQALRAEAAQSPGIWLAGAGLATLAVGGALLTLGLTQRWGEVYPRWVPFLRGKPVRPRTAIIPATVVAILVTSAGMAYLRAMLTGQVSLDWGSGPTLLWPVWGAALGAATLAYHLRRRGHCRHCHRS